MVVDDRPVNLDLLENMLSDDGYEIRPFLKGKMALNSALVDPPDLILLDIMMPEMDGYEVCQELKRIETTRDIPVIFVSAKSVTFDKVKAFNCGGVDYITKPFQLEEVLARVRTHLTLRRVQLEIEDKNRELQYTLKELKSTQSHLIQSEKMASIGVLAAGIAHELNNPINFVSISTKGLKKKLKPVIELLQQFDRGSVTKDDLETINQLIATIDVSPRLQAINELTTNIETGSDRAVEIVSGLRSFSRLDSSKKEKIDIHKTLESALIILQNQFRHRITIQREYGDIPQVLGFPGKLVQVFMNIFKNAIDAIDSRNEESNRKTITIRTTIRKTENGPYINIDIADTGPGISDEIKGQLFDPFYTTKEVGKGIGLGLSIALGIVESHQGKIELTSKKGEGSTFSVLLPIQDKAV